MPTANASVRVQIGALMDSTVGAVFGKTTSGLKKIGDTMRDLASRSQELKRLDAANLRFGESVQSLTTRYDAQAATLAKAEAHFAKIKEKVDAAGAADEKLAAQLTSADAAVVRARTNLDRTNASLTKTKADYTEAGAAADKFRSANQNVEGSLGRLGAAMKRYQGAAAALQANEAKRAEYRSKIVGVLAAGLFIRKSVEKAAEGEQSTLRFKWSLDGQYTQAQIGGLMAKTRAIAAHSLATTPDLLKIQTILHKENLGPDEALAAADAVHKVAMVTQQDSEATAAAIGGIFHAVGLSMSGTTEAKLTRIGDIMATLQQRFKITDVGSLSEGLTKALPQATMARVSFEQVAAAIGEMTRNGSIDAASAGTQMGAMLRNLTKASQGLGFQLVHDTKGNLDFELSLRSMNKRLENMGGLERNRDALTKVFTRRGADAAYFLSQAAATGELAKSQGEMANSAGSVAREYKELEESAQGMILKIGKAWNQFLAPIGRALLPGIKAALEPVGKLFEKFGSFLGEHPMAAKWIGGIATAIIGTTVAVYGCGYAWTFLHGAWLRIGLAWAAMRLKLVAHNILLGEQTIAAGGAKIATDGLAAAETREGIAAKGANAALATRIGLLGKLGIVIGGLGLGWYLAGKSSGTKYEHTAKGNNVRKSYRGDPDDDDPPNAEQKAAEESRNVLPTPEEQVAYQQAYRKRMGLAPLPIGAAMKNVTRPKSDQADGIKIPRMAEGGRVTKPTIALIGEAGPEDVEPLNKRTGVAGTYTFTINAPITINHATDPHAVASQVRLELEHVMRDAEARRRGGMHG